MSTSHTTMLEDIKALKTLEGIARFKCRVYQQDEPALSESLEKIAECLGRASKYLIRDIDEALQEEDHFSGMVASESVPSHRYIEPMEAADKLIRTQSYPEWDIQLQKLPETIQYLHQRIRKYKTTKAAEIKKLLPNRDNAIMFLLGYYEN